MRYWHPFSIEAARAVKPGTRTRSVLVPLYPHFSTTTTGSSLTAWREAAAKPPGWSSPCTTLCCYHSDPGFLRATAAITRRSYEEARATLPPEGRRLRILFSAHGLPEAIIKAGDPYQFQVERTVAGIVRALGIENLDWTPRATSLARRRRSGSIRAPKPRSSAPRTTRWRSWWCRSLSCPNTRRLWWSWTSNTASWRRRRGCPAISAPRPRTATPASSRPLPTWSRRRSAWPQAYAVRWAAAPARTSVRRLPARPRRDAGPGRCARDRGQGLSSLRPA